jgi:hypothetical protein
VTAEPLAPAALPEVAPATRLSRTWLFTYEGHPLTARRPKTEWLIAKQAELSSFPETDPRALDVLREMLDKFFPAPEDRGHITERLNDDADDFDYEDLQAIFVALTERWAAGRPTTPSSGSSSPRKATGGRSTARRR